MSTAVLISGQMRSAERCVQPILQAFPGADFYIHAVQDEDASKASLFGPAVVKVEAQPVFVERVAYHTQSARYVVGVMPVLAQLWGLEKVWELFEAESGSRKYDWIVRCRSDILIKTPPEPESQYRGDLMIPRFSNYWGLNDRFAIMRAKFGKQYFDRRRHLDDYIEKGNIFHPETFLGWTMRDVVTVRTQTIFPTLRKNGFQCQPDYFRECGDNFPGEPELIAPQQYDFRGPNADRIQGRHDMAAVIVKKPEARPGMRNPHQHAVRSMHPLRRR